MAPFVKHETAKPVLHECLVVGYLPGAEAQVIFPDSEWTGGAEQRLEEDRPYCDEMQQAEREVTDAIPVKQKPDPDEREPANDKRDIPEMNKQNDVSGELASARAHAASLVPERLDGIELGGFAGRVEPEEDSDGGAEGKRDDDRRGRNESWPTGKRRE